MVKKFIAGTIQFDVRRDHPSENMADVLAYLEALSEKNVQLAVLPEMFFCSFDNEQVAGHAEFFNPVIERLKRFAKKHKIAISGSLPERQNDSIFNTMVFVDRDGALKGKYRKLHLFRLTQEHLYYTPGNEVVVLDTSFGKVGLMICYDLRFPELARTLYLKGAQIILVSAQWPEARKDHWLKLIQARAIENQLYFICANRTGTESSLDFPGGSVIADPSGELLAKAGAKSGVAAATIDLEMIETARKTIPCMQDRRDDIYG